MKRIIRIFIILYVIVLAYSTHAGTSYLIKCNNESCSFKSSLCIGGGFECSQISGFCHQCSEFVFIHFPKRTNERKKVKDKEWIPVGTIWDPETGKTFEIYQCPKCKGPFIEIQSINQISSCPQCNSTNIFKKATGHYD